MIVFVPPCEKIKLAATLEVNKNTALSSQGQLCLTSGNIRAVTQTRRINQSQRRSDAAVFLFLSTSFSLHYLSFVSSFHIPVLPPILALCGALLRVAPLLNPPPLYSFPAPIPLRHPKPHLHKYV